MFGFADHSGSADSDSDGRANVQEYLRSTNPAQSDIDQDLLTDPVDPYPENYYNGVVPLITILGGNNQTSAPSQFSPDALDIAVWGPTGTTPFVNAPVSFTVLSGGGLLADTTSGTPALVSTLSLRTDIDGSVKSYYKQPASFGTSSQITATASTASVAFTLNTISVTHDTDGDLIPDSWEIDHGLDPNNPADAAIVFMDLTNLQIHQQSLGSGVNPT